MLNLCRVTKLKVFFLLLVYVFNFDLFKFSAAILEKGLIHWLLWLLCIAHAGSVRSRALAKLGDHMN